MAGYKGAEGLGSVSGCLASSGLHIHADTPHRGFLKGEQQDGSSLRNSLFMEKIGHIGLNAAGCSSLTLVWEWCLGSECRQTDPEHAV